MADGDKQDKGKERSKGKEKSKGKGKSAKGKAESESKQSGECAAPTIAGHPRAARSVARAKGWAALIGFLLGGYYSLSSGTVAEALFRALAAGVVCFLAVWAGAVFVWRRLVVLELRAREQRLRTLPPPSADDAGRGAGLEGAR